MYCPSCGSEERQLSRFCRACGTDLRIVRNSLENPDTVTQSAKTAKDLERVAEDVLPSLPAARNLTNELDPALRSQSSITEHTTHHLNTSKN